MVRQALGACNQLTYRNEPFNPWALVRTAGPVIAPALLDELDRLEATPAQPGAAECEPRQQWLVSATEPRARRPPSNTKRNQTLT